MLWGRKQKGFTIVELLIVVVVIAILAAISIIAYTGIQNRAKESAAQNSASQAAKKLATVKITNTSSYPTEATLESLAGFTPSIDGSTPYQYTVGEDLRSYCLTVTTEKISYYVSNVNLTPIKGACVGHGDGGVTPITNLIANPSLEANATHWSLHGSFTGSGAGRVSANGEWAYQGVRTNTAATAIYIMQGSPVAVLPDTVYTASVEMTSSVDRSYSLLFRRGDTGSTFHTESVNLTAGVPTRVVTSANVGSVPSMYLVAYTSTGTAGDTLIVDKAMLTRGATNYTYADGNSQGWSWTGAPSNSTSFGQPL